MASKLREMVISVDANETRVAVLEDRVLVELYVERGTKSVVGNVYLAKVKDVLPGMEAAFVDVGLKKNAFLHVDEVIDHENGEGPRQIKDLLKAGQDVLVQVVKDPMGTKGARVTTHITLPGRYLVLMPYSDFLGISRRLVDEARERLHAIAEEIKPKNMGLIVRTAADGVSSEDLKADLKFLVRLWRKVQRQVKEAQAPETVYTDMDLALRMVRDDFSNRFQRLVVDDKATQDKITSFLSKTSPALVKRVTFHREKTPLFDKYGITEQMMSALGRKVWLKSGGYLAIDKTEALTAIDVNTGKYVGKSSLEETITRTNLEAAPEIARQLRLRDIGGMIILDFIDMERESDREKVYAALTEALAEDRTKSRVVEISSLGLVEMTRKNVTDGLVEVLTDTCPTCGGLGRVVSDETLRIEAERSVIRLARTHRSQAFLFAVDPKTLDLLLEPGRDRLAEMRKATEKWISLMADPTCKPGEVKLVIEGKVPQVEKHLTMGRAGTFLD